MASLTKPTVLLGIGTATLLYGFVALIDGWLLVLVSRRMGVFFALGLEGMVGIAALILVANAVRGSLRAIRESSRPHVCNYSAFSGLIVYVAAGLLLLLPGFASDAVGLAALVPPVRWLLGRLIQRNLRDEIELAHEYVRLGPSDSEGASPIDEGGPESNSQPEKDSAAASTTSRSKTDAPSGPPLDTPRSQHTDATTSAPGRPT